MSLVALKIVVVVNKSPAEKDITPGGDLYLKAEKPSDSNSATIDVWKDADKETPTLLGSVLVETVFAVVGLPTSNLAVRLGQGMSFFIGETKKDSQGASTSGHGVKTSHYRNLTAESVPDGGHDFVVPGDAIHKVQG